MLLFSFDEQGEFENSSYIGPLFVGGFIYNSPDIEDIQTERKRILCFFKKACEVVNTEYPDSLHFRKGYHGEDNGIAVGQTKEEYSAHLAEFVRTGLYNNNPLTDKERRGKYRFFIHLYSPAGKTKYNQNTDNLYISDNKISNRYDHMVKDFIRHALYLNDDIGQKEEVVLDFPSRLAVGKKSDFDAAGYRNFVWKEETGKEDERKIDKYFNTNADIYRAILQSFGEEFPNKSIGKPELNVNSISYGYKPETKDREKYAFLMLADAVCSVAVSVLTSSNTNRLKNVEYSELKNALELKLGLETIFSLYDDADELYTEVYKAIDKKQISKGLQVADSFFQKNSKENSYYKNEFLDKLMESVGNSISTDEKKKLLTELPDLLKKELLNVSQTAKWAKSICHFKKSVRLTPEQMVSYADISLLADFLIENDRCPFWDCLNAINYHDYYVALEKLALTERVELPSDLAEVKEFLTNRVKDEMEPEDFRLLAGSLDDKTREMKIDSSVEFIFDQCIQIKKCREWSDRGYYQAAFSLYKAGIAIRNHQGRPDLAKVYLQQIQKIKRYISDADYNQCMNRFIVSYIDLLDFDSAFRQSLEKTKISGEEETELKKGDYRFDTIEQAKDYSQLAQICSFMNRSNTTLVETGQLTEERFALYKNLAGSFFTNALNRFRKNSDDYKITMNYYLHYLVSEGETRYLPVSEFEESVQTFEADGKRLTKAQERKREKLLAKRKEIEELQNEYNDFKNLYLKYAAEYFGSDNLKEQLDSIMSLLGKKKPRINPEYSLALWCKALLVFFSKSDIRKVMSVFPKMQVINSISSRHPWELTCSYLARIYNRIGQEKDAEEMLALITKEMESTPLLSIIVSNAYLKYYSEAGQKEKAENEQINLEKKLRKYTNKKLPKQDGEAETIVTYSYS